MLPVQTAAPSQYVAADHGLSVATIENHLDELRSHVEPRFLVRGVAWGDFARELLEAMPHRRVAPSEQDMVRVLHRVGALNALLRDNTLRAASYLDDDALCAIDRVAPAWLALGEGRGNIADYRHTSDLLERFNEIEPDLNVQAALRVAFVRGVNGIYDTYITRERLRQREADIP